MCFRLVLELMKQKNADNTVQPASMATAFKGINTYTASVNKLVARNEQLSLLLRQRKACFIGKEPNDVSE